MAIEMVSKKKNYCAGKGVYKCEHIADTDADLANLPEGCGTGSTAVSLESGKVMVVNTQGKWVEFGG